MNMTSAGTDGEEGDGLKATVIGCVVACSPTLDESYRRATTQAPIRGRGLTQISQAGNPKRPRPYCQAGSTASSTPLLLNAQMPWGGHPLCGRPAGYLRHLTMADRAQGQRPESRPKEDDSDPGLASRRERDPTARRGTLKPAWSASTHSKGKGPEDPGASCEAQRGNCRLQSVQVGFLFPLLRFQFHLRPAFPGDCSQNSTSSSHLEIASCALRRCDHAATSSSSSLDGVQPLLKSATTVPGSRQCR